MDRLYRALPGSNVPRKPEDPCFYDLQTFDVVWYRHTDNEWYPALVTGPAPPPQMSSRYAGHKLWHGLVRGLDSNKPASEEQVYLCPTLGNAKPDGWYTRLLLQVHGKICDNNETVDLLIETFKVVVQCPCGHPNLTAIDPRLLSKV